MNKLIVLAGVALVAVGAYADEAITTVINGVEWRFRINPETKTAVLGHNTATSGSTGRDDTSLHACSKEINVDAADIPWEFDYENVHYTVDTVGLGAFYYHGKLTGTLTIPSSVKAMRGYSFQNCTGLTRLVGGDSVTNWQYGVFMNCKNMAGTYPDFSAVTVFDAQAFANTALTGKLKLGDSLTSLGAGWVFFNCNFPEAVIPANVTAVGRGSALYGTFRECGEMNAIWIKGPSTAANQTYTTVYCETFAEKCTSLKVVLMGKNTKGAKMTTTGDNAMLSGVDGVQVLLPDNGYWEGLVLGGGENNKVWYYGPNRELDLTIDETAKTVKFTPTTENALSNVVAWVPTIKQHFELDTVISVTNRIEMSVALDEEMLQNVTLEAPPWYLTFAVKNQTQLDNVLSAVSADTPIVIDIQGAGKNQIAVPEGRKVAILAKSGWTFGAKPNGLTITFK